MNMLLFSLSIVIVRKNVEKRMVLMILLNETIIHLCMSDPIQLVRVDHRIKVNEKEEKISIH